mgnify:CR=1 FL=1
MNKIFNKRTLIIFIIEMMMTVIYLFIKGFDTIVNYCNAFFVSGFAIICIGGLSWLSNIGTFDIFGYSWKTLKSSFSKDVKRDYNSMYEYNYQKLSKILFLLSKAVFLSTQSLLHFYLHQED